MNQRKYRKQMKAVAAHARMLGGWIDEHLRMWPKDNGCHGPQVAHFDELKQMFLDAKKEGER